MRNKPIGFVRERLGMAKILTLVGAIVVALATTFVLVGSVGANEITGATITCTEVSGNFIDFVKVDHPIVWNVKINSGSFQTVTTTEAPPGFIGSGTASADISSLTSGFAGQTITVSAFAQWATGKSSTFTEDVTCDAPPTTSTTTTTTTTIPVIVAPEVVNAPAAVVVAPSFTG
jgi:hypothetical protein